MTLIQKYFERIQRRLHAEGQAAKSFDHSLNIGQIREAFIREFLQENISPMWRVGTGEIIHKNAQENEQRNQIDVVVHNNRYPKISLSTGIDLFFIETVSSFIEIKSTLRKDDLRKFAKVTKNIKKSAKIPPQKFNLAGIAKIPRPYSFIFAYEGPNKVETILKWMKEIAAEEDYNLSTLKKTDPKERDFFNNLFVDGIFVLRKGYVLVDALPIQSNLVKLDALPLDHIWIYGKENELSVLWLLVNTLNERLMWNDFDMTKYLGAIKRWVEN